MAALSTPSPNSTSSAVSVNTAERIRPEGVAGDPNLTVTRLRLLSGEAGGHVSRLRQNWVVHEDGALAERLQSQEYHQHLSGNKQRNHQIREDFPQALQEQTRERVHAQMVYQDHIHKVREQEDRDAEIARRMALEWEAKEREHRAYEATRDEIFARRIQNLEAGKRPTSAAAHQPDRHSVRPASHTQPLPVLSNGDVPYASSDISEMSRPSRGGAERLLHYERDRPLPESYQVKMARPARVTPEPLYANNQPEHYAVSSPYPSPDDGELGAAGGGASGQAHRAGSLSPELLEAAGLSQRDVALSRRAEEQLEQERRDRELARILQEQLSTEEVGLASRDSDRAAKDLEFARRIQLKEKEKLKRAKERSRLKKLEQQHSRQLAEADDIVSESRSHSRLSKQSHTSDILNESHVSIPLRRPYMNRAAIDDYDSGSNSEPQYENVGPQSRPHLTHPHQSRPPLHTQKQYPTSPPSIPSSEMTPSPEVNGPTAQGTFSSGTSRDMDDPVPPYMPMQQSQSRKSSSLEKRILKKKEKEGCKQQ
ncbi:hypothetical protein TCAL_14276 [Tigriopus californicus]|uniref:Coiled-coil domain-containing protein n=1 Tax=Tigriopus californicus TaxID=6832 RepID=A0A553NUQ0_TIGCA|nr:uncharacterized protein LOC131884665 [Tigriopus californicus]TRY69161.1 hypothetical protein TCAL_14276 [Tigriopus californicus]